MTRLENAISNNSNMKGEELVNAIIKDAETCASKNIVFDELDELFKPLEQASSNNIIQCVEYALNTSEFTLSILNIQPFEIVYSLYSNKTIRNSLIAAGVDEKSFIRKYFVTDCKAAEPEEQPKAIELPMHAEASLEASISPATVDEILNYVFANTYFANVLNQVGLTKKKIKLNTFEFKDITSAVQKFGALATEENITKFVNELVTYLFKNNKIATMMQSIGITKEYIMTEVKEGMNEVFAEEQNTDAIVIGDTSEPKNMNPVEVINPNGKVAAVVNMNNNKKNKKKDKRNNKVTNNSQQPAVAFNHSPKQVSELDKHKAKLLSIVKFSKDRTEVNTMQFNGLYRGLTAQNFQGMIHNNVNQVKHNPSGPYLWEVKEHPMFNKAQYDFCFGADSNITNTRLLILMNSISQTILVNAIPAQDVPNPEC